MGFAPSILPFSDRRESRSNHSTRKQTQQKCHHPSPRRPAAQKQRYVPVRTNPIDEENLIAGLSDSGNVRGGMFGGRRCFLIVLMVLLVFGLWVWNDDRVEKEIA
ncbi:hypothetical protein BASA81_003197 [Batrachochytrium salamandrivorans]|nr:hypothetical protein BASA81_003197 [Batrachochytrium salamandrivorans]